MFTICQNCKTGRPGRRHGPKSFGAGNLLLEPVIRRGGEDRLATDGFGRAVERVGGGAPDRVMRRGAMRLQRGFVLVDLVEVVGVLVLRVLQDVEAGAAGLVALGAERIDLDRLEKIGTPVRLDLHLHPDRDHFGFSLNSRWPDLIRPSTPEHEDANPRVTLAGGEILKRLTPFL